MHSSCEKLNFLARFPRFEWVGTKNSSTVKPFLVFCSPLCNIQTMMRPLTSLVVSFACCSFHMVTWTASECPSSVWFIDRLLGAANPLTSPSKRDSPLLRYKRSNHQLLSSPVWDSNLSTLRRPSFPPQAMKPFCLFQEILFRATFCGIAIFLDK